MRNRLLGKGVPAEKIALIPPWADIDELQPLPRGENPLRNEWNLQDKTVVMYSGNLGLAHDIDTLRGAMERLKTRDDLRFVFVGGGKLMTKLQAYCEEHNMANALFKPYQPREAIRASLSLADLHLISQAEAMTGLLVPSKLYGIMAAGRASVFIGNAQAEVGRVLVETGSGRVVAVGDVQGLTDTITQLADDPDACRRMGDAARQAMADTYDRRHACAAWERLLTECVSGKPTDPTDDTSKTATADTVSAEPAQGPGKPAMTDPSPTHDPPNTFQRLDRVAGYPYPKREYLRRFVWLIVQATLIRTSPGRAMGWRRFWLRRFGAKVGKLSGIRPTTRIVHPWLLTLHDFTMLGDHVTVYNLGQVTVGEHSVVSQNTHLCAGTHDYTKPQLPLVRSTITIGKGVWVCADAFVGPGVTIGDNAVVGARAVVVRDVEPGVVVAGNPAKFVKTRPMTPASAS